MQFVRLFCFGCLFFSLKMVASVQSNIQLKLDSLKSSLYKFKGEERVLNFLEQADLYYHIQLDSAFHYTSMAKKEAKNLSNQWGYYKALYFESKIKMHNFNIVPIELQLEKCTTWFEQNKYQREFLESKLLLLDCYSMGSPIEDIENGIAEIFDKVNEFGDPILICTAWRVLYKIQANDYAQSSRYFESLDSLKYYAYKSGDSLEILQTELQRILHNRLSYSDSLRDNMIAVFKQWENQYLLNEFYAILTLVYGRRNQLDSVIVYRDLNVSLAEKYGSKLAIANSDKLTSLSYYINNEAEKAFSLIKRSSSSYKELGNIYEYYHSLKGIGSFYEKFEDDYNQTKYYIKALEQAEILQNKSYIYLTKASLAKLFMINKEYYKAEKMFLEVLNYIETDMSGRMRYRFLGKINTDLGNLYSERKQYDDALERYDTAFVNFYKINHANAKAIVGRKISLFLNSGELTKATEMYNFSQKDIHLKKVKKEIGFSHVEGKLFYAQKKFEQSKKSLMYYLESSAKNFYSNEREEANRLLFEINNLQGNYKEALKYYKITKAIEDSIQINNAKENIALLESKHELSQKEQELLKTEAEKEIQALTLARKDEKIEKQELYILAIVLIILLSVSWGLFLLKRYSQQQKDKQRVLEEKQVKTIRQLKLAELRSNLFTNISHELRTPLTLLVGPLKELSKRAPEDFKPDLNRAYRNASHLKNLIDESLSLSKLQIIHPDLALDLTLVPIGKFVVSIAEGFLSFAESKSIMFSIIDKSDKLTANIDREKIRKIIVNLLSNAFKYTNPGGEICIEINRIEDKMIFINISDDGIGIEEEHISHIFERFYQVNSDKEGLGIGLAMSKELIELHHGKITVESTPGKGSCFMVEIPLTKVVRRLNSKKNGSFIKSKGESGKLHIDSFSLEKVKKKVLVVEDHQDLRDYIKEILDEYFEVLDCDNGLEGVKMAEENFPDLIISDVMMPYKDGLELAIQLKESVTTSHIPIILLTAKASLEHRLEGLKTGVDDYITKPFDKEEIVQRSLNLIAQREKLKNFFNANYFVSPYKMVQNKMDQEFLEKAESLVEHHIMDISYSTELFSQGLSMNRMLVHNKLKALTGRNASQFIKSIKIRKAAKLLQETSYSIGEVTDLCGFGSRETFNKSFREQFGMTPTEFRRKEGFVSVKKS